MPCTSPSTWASNWTELNWTELERTRFTAFSSIRTILTRSKKNLTYLAKFYPYCIGLNVWRHYAVLQWYVHTQLKRRFNSNVQNALAVSDNLWQKMHSSGRQNVDAKSPLGWLPRSTATAAPYRAVLRYSADWQGGLNAWGRRGGRSGQVPARCRVVTMSLIGPTSRFNAPTNYHRPDQRSYMAAAALPLTEFVLPYYDMAIFWQ